jgi:hypothetical protein
MIKATTYGKGRDALDVALREHKSFKTGGALHGEEWDRAYVSINDLGQLPREHANAFMLDHMTGITYVVWSYDTPIAWVRKDGTVVEPDVRYSRTTSKHQGRLYLL